MSTEVSMLNIINDSFAAYSAMTIQDRAIVDARDGLKPSQRQCMYSLLLNKYTYKKPFVKSQACVGKAMADFYVHGDSSCYDLLTRMARKYNMNYPLMDFSGQYGTITNGKPSAARYTDMRLGELGYMMYEGLDEDCVDIWFDNYSGLLQFPSVLPSLGYYNICNGTSGIATSLSSSIPQFNLREVNEAMIKLLWNPDIDYDEIYCPPDFCIGGTILNASEVKEILRYGGGENVKGKFYNNRPLKSSVRMRATASYDDTENAIYFTEIPYGVYVQTITEQIVNGINNGEITGIAHSGIKDLSKNEANLKIVLEKNVNPNVVIKRLFKLTDLDCSYTINMTMLDNGTRPKVFSWKEALQAHIDHEIVMRTRIHQYHIKKIAERIHIIDGLIVAINNIDEVVNLIKHSSDKEQAKINLINRFELDDDQAEAILKMSLSKLTNLEVESFEKEKAELQAKSLEHEAVLEDTDLLYKEIENGLREVANKFGSERKTRLSNFDFSSEAEDAEPIETKELLIHFTNLNNIYTQESTSLVTKRRGSASSKFKLRDNEVVIKTISDNNLGSVLAFSNKGKMYNIYTSELPINAMTNVSRLFTLDQGEKITAFNTISKKADTEYFVFVTKNGIIKKTDASLYKTQRQSIQAINLKDDDEVIAVLFIKDENIGILSKNGNIINIDSKLINPIGRTSMGVQGMKLKEGDEVISAKIISGDTLVTISEKGMIKKTSLDEFPTCSRGTVGKKISGTAKDDNIVNFLTIDKDCDIIIISNQGTIKINTSEVRLLSRTAIGVKAMTIKEDLKVVDLVN